MRGLKRPFDTFLSHAHTDKSIVDSLDHWLYNVCRIRVWYDDRDLPPGAQIATELSSAIASCSSMIIILSKESVDSGWVKEEYEAAVGQRTSTRGLFRIIGVRIEDCVIPGFLGTTKYIDIQNAKVDLNISNKLLEGLYFSDIDINLEKTRDLYVSRTWQLEPSGMADKICRLLIRKGFTLIGDSEDQTAFNVDRIRSIMINCGGFAAILPDRGNGSTSKYVVREIAIGQSLGLPSLIAANSCVHLDLPSLSAADPSLHLLEALTESAILLDAKATEDQIESRLEVKIEDLGYELKPPAHPPFVFFGTELSEMKNQILKEHIQRIGGIPCIIGDKLGGAKVQQLITEKISDATFVIADISEDNLNTLIEAGIAIGAGRRLHLVARGPRRSPPFMFRDREIEYYSDDVELLGILHRIVYPYRRRIINYEFPK